MKISNSIRKLYEEQRVINELLEKRITELIGASKHSNWFFKGRIKQIESFAQKLETGRFLPEKLEDFFACTLVVENKNMISNALKLVETYCDIIYQKPKDKEKTHKFPDVFSFDDLRLYVKLKSSEASPQRLWDGVLFEIQIKTFLQHAWSIATHDLIYKGDSISWGKARLAFQIKAMLEHAEISIEQVDSIATSSDLATIDPKTKNWQDILGWLQTTWGKDYLPENVVGLVQTISDIILYLDLRLGEIKNCIEKDNRLGFGAKSLNLSPYEAIIKSIANHKPAVLLSFLNDDTGVHRKRKIFITPEMEIDSFLVGASKNRIVYSDPSRIV